MKRQISIIGVPMDLGQKRRGVDMGPSAIRYAGIVERLESLCYEVKDLGDLTVQYNTYRESPEGAVMNKELVTQVNEDLAQAVDGIVRNKAFPLILGGDHSIAMGSLAGIAKHYNNLGVIWYDAHGDLNTSETSPSGNAHGMSLAASLGLGDQAFTDIHRYVPKVKPENVILIGARLLDEGEKELIKQKNIKVYTMHEIDRVGMAQVMQEAIDYLRERTDGVHLSLDLDALDPSDAPGVGTPVIGGLSYRESHLAMEMLAESGLITSAEFVEVNPILDEKNKTAIATVALAGSLFGEVLL
ncbi:MAG: arginase [Bacillus sp. (in: firmicutes)]